MITHLHISDVFQVFVLKNRSARFDEKAYFPGRIRQMIILFMRKESMACVSYNKLGIEDTKFRL